MALFFGVSGTVSFLDYPLVPVVLLSCRSNGPGDATVSHRISSVANMKTSLAPQTLTAPVAFRTSRGVAGAMWAASAGQDRYWYERDLSIDELRAAVAKINEVSRAGRR